MKSTSTFTNVVNFGMSLSAYFVMVWIGIRILLQPTNYLDFIYNTSFIWWTMEFLSIAAVIVLYGKTKDGHNWQDSPLLYFSYFGFFFLGIFLISNERLSTGLFGISLASKFFWAKTIKADRQTAINEIKKITAISGAAMILCTFLALIISDTILGFSSFSDEIMRAMPDNIEMANPLLFVVWGILYGTTMITAKVIFTLKKYI